MNASDASTARREGLACLLLVVAVFAPYCSASVLPFHDSIVKYQFFHYAYSQVIAAGELPLWIPYGNYGHAAGLHQLSMLTPASYLAGAAGLVFGVADTLVLFKAAYFLEVALYAAGLLLLARSVYEHAPARWLVVIGGVGALSWWSQPFFNLYAFYLYPYLLLFLFRFLRTGEPGALWLAAAAGLASLIGTAPYFAPLHAFVFVLIFGMALATGARPGIPWTLKAWLLRRETGVVLALAAILGVAAWLSQIEIMSFTDGRDPDSNRVPLEVFLEHGRNTKLTAAYGYLTGDVTHGDNTYYIGWLPLVLVAAGLFRVRQPLFLGVAAAALGLVWLSFGGVFASMAYWFPGMSLFRHIGLTYGLSGLLLLVACGWVVDDLSGRRAGSGAPAAEGLGRQRLIVVVVLTLMAVDGLASWRPDDGNVLAVYQQTLLILVPLRLVAYAMAAIACYRRGEGGLRRCWAGWLVAYAFDIGSYQAAVLLTLPRSTATLPAGAFAPDPLPYREARSNEGATDAAVRWKLALFEERATVIGTRYVNRNVHALTYTFIGVDPCRPTLRSETWQRGVRDALAARSGHPRDARSIVIPREDAPFMASLGCGAPKIAWAAGAVAARSGAHARELLKSVPDPHATPVVEAAAGLPAEAASPVAYGDIRVIHFSANRVVVEASHTGAGAAWLYYADAMHPGWRARVDGQAVPVARANVGFKAIPVPPGRHTVELVFGEGLGRAVSWLLACVAAALCLAALAFAAASIAGRRR